MTRVFSRVAWPWWAPLLLSLWSCGGASESDAGEFLGTVLTLELAALDREDAWYLRPVSVGYFVAPAENGSTETWEGTFELVGNGAAELTDGGRTEILRAMLELPPGRYEYAFRLRDSDEEVIFTVQESIGVAADARTEIYSLFDLKTADPVPIMRPVDIDLRIVASPQPPTIDTIDYAITCAETDPFLDSALQAADHAVRKRSILCDATASGTFERVDDQEGQADLDSRWATSYDVGCGPCVMEVIARNGAGEGLCTASVEFDVVGWGFAELPAEQVSVSLPCEGSAP
ncbi:MAG: hypothetical protein WBG86_04185 [Polyangiales bacterium]